MKTQFLPNTYALRDSKKIENTPQNGKVVIDSSPCTTREDRIVKSIETLREREYLSICTLCDNL
jgi:hypothetical protein